MTENPTLDALYGARPNVRPMLGIETLCVGALEAVRGPNGVWLVDLSGPDLVGSIDRTTKTFGWTTYDE